MKLLIAEIISQGYDSEGKKVFRPDSRRHSGFKPTFPAGRFLSQPLQHWCSDLSGIQHFLSKCKYVSDEEQFGSKDYWQPPEDFESSQKGDCEDFALWVWRQMLHLNYPARFVLGTAGRYGAGHAWVSFQRDGHTFLLEALSWPVGLKLPRLSFVRYKPKFSISWDGEKISYFEHEDRKIAWTFRLAAQLVGEWLIFWTSFWIIGVPKLIIRKLSPRRCGQNSEA